MLISQMHRRSRIWDDDFGFDIFDIPVSNVQEAGDG